MIQCITSVEVKSVRGLDNHTNKNSVLVRYILEQEKEDKRLGQIEMNLENTKDEQ